MDTKTKTVIPETKRKICLTVGCSKRRNFFPGIFHPHNHRLPLFYAYLQTTCPCSWAIEICKNIRIRGYFGLVTIDCGDGSRHIAILRHDNKLAIFCIAHLSCIFQGISCELITILATLLPEKLQGFYPILLLHCYILTTDSHELGRERSL